VIKRKFVEYFAVAPGRRAGLRKRATSAARLKLLRELSEDELKDHAKAVLQRDLDELSEAQELLWASDTHSVLVVFQAMDAAGKDGTIKHVMSGVNPQGCQVYCFKQPSAEEVDHNFLWRSMKALPERGRIGIFNRSYYEDVLVVKVHPEILEGQKLPDGKRGKSFWDARYDDINAFERHLDRNGTTVVKFFLHVSKKEQKRRFLERLGDEEKQWKFSLADLRERGFWDEYQDAYEDCLTATSTPWAPWYVIPADHKWAMRAVVAGILARRVNDLGLRFPEVTDEQRKRLAAARRSLRRE